jgi:hypothetical protein
MEPNVCLSLYQWSRDHLRLGYRNVPLFSAGCSWNSWIQWADTVRCFRLFSEKNVLKCNSLGGRMHGVLESICFGGRPVEAGQAGDV